MEQAAELAEQLLNPRSVLNIDSLLASLFDFFLIHCIVIAQKWLKKSCYSLHFLFHVSQLYMY